MTTPAPMIDSPCGRPVKEWIGKRLESMPPRTVRMRIFDRWKECCHITGAKINVGDKWDLDHIKRLADGGENRESNLAPALHAPHKDKTADETRRGRDADRARMAHLGIRNAPSVKLKGAPFRKYARAAARMPREPVKRVKDCFGRPFQ